MPFGVVMFKKFFKVGFFVGGEPANERGAWPRKKIHNFLPLISLGHLDCFYFKNLPKSVLLLVVDQVIKDATLQNFIYKHTIDLKNVQRNKKRENLQDIELAQARCQNLSKLKTDHL